MNSLTFYLTLNRFWWSPTFAMHEPWATLFFFMSWLQCRQNSLHNRFLSGSASTAAPPLPSVRSWLHNSEIMAPRKIDTTGRNRLKNNRYVRVTPFRGWDISHLGPFTNINMIILALVRWNTLLNHRVHQTSRLAYWDDGFFVLCMLLNLFISLPCCISNEY